MMELEADTFDEQLTRAVATRAAMLQRQGIDSALAYNHNVVREIEHELACQRAHETTERVIKVLILCVAAGLYFGFLA